VFNIMMLVLGEYFRKPTIWTVFCKYCFWFMQSRFCSWLISVGKFNGHRLQVDSLKNWFSACGTRTFSDTRGPNGKRAASGNLQSLVSE